ncbi:MAG TPA: glycoside hydrolase family 3 N-terminal domain-containing protein, partial [Polyangiaceae bacterium]|nr:glycoside hydrolase family 3 N-terminal domain-containing protein [Polyangiaceae bacterium]
MSRLAPFTSLSTVLVAGLFLSGACGHTKDTLEAYKKASEDSGTTGDTGGETNPNVFPDSAYANVPSCEPPSRGLPQFDCMQADSLQFDKANMKGYCVPDEVKTSVDTVLSAMSSNHKAIQMLGIPEGKRDYRDIERSPDVTVPGAGEIRGYRYRDAGRGVNMDAGQDNRPNDKKNYATAFPAPSLRAASWDLDLERRIGSAIGDETAASLNNMNLGPCMNIVRHPFWGRTQETYGEDSYSIGRMSTAYSVGVQEYVVGCAKHFAANNIEYHRSQQNAVMSEQTLREIYGRHFEMIIQDGSMGCIMAAYNLINGVKATQSEHLLRDILKGPVSEGGMGFEGLVITDWWAMPGDQVTPDAPTAQSDTIQAVIAGTDIEVPWQMHYSEATLANADQTLVEDAARRILTQKFLFNSAKSNQPWSKKKPT